MELVGESNFQDMDEKNNNLQLPHLFLPAAAQAKTEAIATSQAWDWNPPAAWKPPNINDSVGDQEDLQETKRYQDVQVCFKDEEFRWSIASLKDIIFNTHPDGFT